MGGFFKLQVPLMHRNIQLAKKKKITQDNWTPHSFTTNSSIFFLGCLFWALAVLYVSQIQYSMELNCWFGRALWCIVVLSWQLLRSAANKCHERRHLSQQHLLCNSLLWSWLMDCGVLWTSVPHCHTSHSECRAYLIPAPISGDSHHMPSCCQEALCCLVGHLMS